MNDVPAALLSPNTFYQDICVALEQHANPLKAKGMSAYMKDKFIYFGLTSPIRRSKTKDILKKSKSLTPEDLWTLTHLLWTAEEREFQYAAMDIWSKNIKRLQIDDIHDIERIISHKSWWDTVDWLASHMVGAYFKCFPEALIGQTEKWVHSDNMWLNRTCLLYQLSYKGETDFDRLCYYIDLLKDKKEFFIQKAIGWSLRQYSRTDKAAVTEVVERLELNGLARREALRLIVMGKV